MLSVASCSGTSLRKRRNDSDFDDEECSGIKVPRNMYYFVLESESEVPSTEEDTESVCSIQNKSTDFAKDTSDTCTKSSHYETDYESLAGLEYEVASLSEQENNKPFDSCSSSCDSPLWRRTHVGQDTSSEDEDAGGPSVWADMSSQDSEPETTVASMGPHTCIKCRASTSLLHYCHNCHKVRKDFFPPRPKRCKKKNSTPLGKKKSNFKKPFKLSLDRTESGIGSSSSQELVPVPTPALEAPASIEGLCNICFKNPKNSGFLHSRWVHIYSCYQCSLKVWFSNKFCPICKGKVSQVVKVTVV